jgi:hypothetical protein
MNSYRLYFLDTAGHIHQAVEFACDGDETALAKTAEHHDGRPMELWSLDRRVGAFAPAYRQEAL